MSDSTIWKFALTLSEHQLVKIPGGNCASFLDVQVQDGQLTLWAIVDPNDAVEDARICVFGTGNAIDDDINDLDHIGTVQMDGLVWHVFEYTGHDDDWRGDKPDDDDDK